MTFICSECGRRIDVDLSRTHVRERVYACGCFGGDRYDESQIIRNVRQALQYRHGQRKGGNR